MSEILVVCTGNICRSPMAAGFLRAAFAGRLGEAAPVVTSAGIAGGDLALGSIGTVAYRDRSAIWAFGHPIDAAGQRALRRGVGLRRRAHATSLAPPRRHRRPIHAPADRPSPSRKKLPRAAGVVRLWCTYTATGV
jgi:hypothetical protein